MLTALTLSLLTLAPQSRTSAQPPRLVVLVSVDQLIPEQLQRLEGQLGGGLGRFLRQGAVFWNATVDYAATETGPGHASLATGRYPAHHGIVGNAFVDRTTRQSLYCVGDAQAHALTSAGTAEQAGSVSPANLIGPALGDLLQEAQAKSITVSVAGKDRSAVLMGGRSPDVALWWDLAAGGFASSDHYGRALPEFVNIWNAAWAERARGWEWSCQLPAGMRDVAELARLGTAGDDRAGETRRFGRTLPRRLPETDLGLAAALFFTPLIDYFTLEMATLAADSLELGRDDAVDLLAVGLSGCDAVGHSYGPFSLEVTDLLLRADRDLERLFAHLDERVGAGRWLAVLSSDHGVLDLPEKLRAEGVGARRLPGEEWNAMLRTVNEAVAAISGDGAQLDLRMTEQGFCFDVEAARAAGLDPVELRRLIANSAAEAPFVEQAYTLEDLTAASSAESEDPWLRLYQRCQFDSRGADVVLRLQPWLLVQFPEGTSHGSPYPYDRRVPLCFLGPGVKAQRRFDPASPVDAVPSVLSLLKLKLPADLDGRALALD